VSGQQDGRPNVLTEFQIDLARAFFELPESAGFLLAGGAALAAQGLTTRPTEDLDLFTAPGHADVARAADALIALVETRGCRVRRIRDSGEFVRLRIDGPTETVVIDLAVDATPLRPAAMTFLGPTLDRKTSQAGRWSRCSVERRPATSLTSTPWPRSSEPNGYWKLAHEIDRGFDETMFADMLRSLVRFTDDEIPVPGRVGPGDP